MQRVFARRTGIVSRALTIVVSLALPLVGGACSTLFPSDNKQPPPVNTWIDYRVKLNTVGFLPGRAKLATVVQPSGTAFDVVSVADKQIKWSGTLSAPLNADLLGGDGPAAIADFTELTQTGRFYVEVPGVGRSVDFSIGPDVYVGPLNVAVLGLTGARCGSAVSVSLGGQTFSHKACHLNDAYRNYFDNQNVIKPSLRGWHDAGDYGKYTTNGAFTAGMLLQAWERFEPKLSGLAFELPEKGGALPDFLDEIKWQLDWLATMQFDDGGVSFKATALNFEGFVMPESDDSPRYYAPVGSGATGDFAAVMAMAARIYRPYDAAFADACLEAAMKAYAFLQANPGNMLPDISMFRTGTYRDATDFDERLWAAAEIWETTGDAAVLADFETRGGGVRTLPANFDWPDVSSLAYFTYVLSKRDGRDPAAVTAVTNAIVAAADGVAGTAALHAFGRGLAGYYWGSTGVVVRQGMLLWTANALAPAPKYLDALAMQLDHVLGRNPYGRSLITGVGYHPPIKPHHRPSGSDSAYDPWPGLLVGGPAEAGGVDWQDAENAYNVNEVAINWTAPVIFSAAALLP